MHLAVAAASAALLVALAGCGAAPPPRPSAPVESAAVPTTGGGEPPPALPAAELPASAVGPVAAAALPGPVPKLVYVSGIALELDAPGFGGFSALDVSEDGTRLLAVSDRGRALGAELDYDAAGVLRAAHITGFEPILDPQGAPLTGTDGDAEGLTRLPDGGLAVSFERDHRILRYGGDPRVSVPALLPGPEGLPLLHQNSGLETLTALADGRLLAIAEGPECEGGTDHIAWIGGPGGWQTATYRTAANYKPTDATLLPSGDVLVLERRDPQLFILGGRVMLLPAAAVAAGGVLQGIEIGRLTPPQFNSNFEAIAAWQDERGRTQVLIMPDDNFSPLLITMLLQFVLEADGDAPQALQPVAESPARPPA